MTVEGGKTLADKEFRFSPRPNRAAEINWREWGAEAFAEAERDAKPILLAISGVWCHWCHVMDETSYSDPEIIDYLNQNYIPIRVDTDRRPDINERYNLGGWPTTAILNARGDLLTGGTYIPAKDMKLFLRKVLRAYQDNRAFLESPETMADTIEDQKDEPIGELSREIWDEVAQMTLQDYDELHGGFGTQPKFPMPDALELAINAYHSTMDERWKKVFSYSLHRMASGGMYDQVEGGFFRYSTTRDWSIPHFEKMLEDNALLLLILTEAFQITRDPWFEQVARDVIRFLENNLYLPEWQGWAGTQDADEEYYQQDLEGRKKLTPPFVDRTIYVNWNGLLCRSLILAAAVWQESSWLNKALQTLQMLKQRCYLPDKGMCHYYDGHPHLWSLLTDQTAVGSALNLAYQQTGELWSLEMSRSLAEFCLNALLVPRGGFYDSVPDPTAPGALAVPHLDFSHNVRAARWLLELTALTRDNRFAEAATGALRRNLDRYPRYGSMAAGFALAVREAIEPWTTLTLVGQRGQAQAQAMHQAAMTTYHLPKVVRWLDPVSQPDLVKTEGYELDGPPRLYPCCGSYCQPPIDSVDQLPEVMKKTTDNVKPEPNSGMERTLWQT